MVKGYQRGCEEVSLQSLGEIVNTGFDGGDLHSSNKQMKFLIHPHAKVCAVIRVYICVRLLANVPDRNVEITFVYRFEISTLESQCGINYRKRSGVNECGNALGSSSHVVIRLLPDL